jgi:dipeptidyl aminopeptidase/acylaminoacyl peptidase
MFAMPEPKPEPAMRRRGLAALALGLAATLALCACAPMRLAAPADTGRPAAIGIGIGSASASGDTMAPNANLVVQGIPPIPKGIADDAARYNDFRGHVFVDWHPTKREMLVAYRKAGGATTQIFRVASPLAEPEALTDFADPVRNASYEPITGDSIVFERSAGGDEAAQIYRLDLASRQVTLVSAPNQRHELQGWLHRSSRLLYLSLPLDRTAAGGRRAEVTQTLSLVDPAHPETRRTLAELPGGGWNVGGVSWDDRRLSLTRYLSANESQVWLLDIASGEKKQLLPLPGSATRATHFADIWKRDDSGFFVISDSAGEFRELMFYDVAAARLVPVTKHLRWDVTGVDASADGRLLAVRADVDGREDLLFFDGDSFDELPSPQLPSGSVIAARFHPHLPVLAFALNSSQGPSQVSALNPADGATEAWTRPFVPAGVDPAQLGEQQIVRWKSFDGREISGIVNLPPARFTGKRPVLIDIRGGPESQARFGFIGRYNYFVEELGIALIRPNVRGSEGFGKTFLSLDDGMKREDAVKDIGALLDWIAT